MSDRAETATVQMLERALSWRWGPEGDALAARMAAALDAMKAATDEATRLCPPPAGMNWALGDAGRLDLVAEVRDTSAWREWVRIRHRQRGGIVAEYTLTEWQDARPSWLVAGRMPAWLKVCRVRRRRGPL